MKKKDFNELMNEEFKKVIERKEFDSFIIRFKRKNYHLIFSYDEIDYEGSQILMVYDIEESEEEVQFLLNFSMNLQE